MNYISKEMNIDLLHYIPPLSKIMELTFFNDVHLGLINVAVNKLITDETQNIFTCS